MATVPHNGSSDNVLKRKCMLLGQRSTRPGWLLVESLHMLPDKIVPTRTAENKCVHQLESHVNS